MKYSEDAVLTPSVGSVVKMDRKAEALSGLVALEVARVVERARPPMMETAIQEEE